MIVVVLLAICRCQPLPRTHAPPAPQPGEVWVGEMVVSAHDEYWRLPAWELEDGSGVPIPDPTWEMVHPRREKQRSEELLG